MYDIPEDCLLTYDPNFMDFHSDSTDFEDSQIQRVTTKNGNHSLVSKKKKKPKHIISKNPITYKANISNIKISKNTFIEKCEAETIDKENGKGHGDRQSYVSKQYRMELASSDQIETVKSKRSLIRHKVIPCISGMFKRSYDHGKRMPIIKKRNAKKEDGCQTFRVSYEPKMKQLDRRQQSYVNQPVHDPERKTRQIPQSKNSHKPILTRKIQRCEYINAQYSLTSSSEAGHIEASKKKDKSWKWKKPTVNDIMKSYVNEPEQQNFGLDKELRNNSSKRRRKFPFQIYANPCQYPNKNTANPPKVNADVGSTTSAVPSTCSGFWDYLFNKINNKYQTPKPDIFKPCDCHHSKMKFMPHSPKQSSPKACSVYPCSSTPCPPELYPPKATYPDPKMPDGKRNSSPKTCQCNTSGQSAATTNLYSTPQRSFPDSLRKPASPQRSSCSPKQQAVLCETSANPKNPHCMLPNCPTSIKGTKPKDKIDCKCPSESSSQSKDLVKSCQIPHACMTSNISQKYNGEILCIHNPPCVLINGCLNLPYPKPEPVSTTMWPVVECNRASFQHLFRKKRPKNYIEQASQYQAVEQASQYQPMSQSQYRLLEQSCQYQLIDQSCQYQTPSTEQNDITDRSCQYYPEMVNTCQVTDHKKEKMIQSSCNHKPPCEVKRTCYRPKYDPLLQNSCIHVPMCDNLPMCILDSSYKDNGQPNKTCRHKPKCSEVPICRRHNYLDLPKPAREELGTQVRPRSKMICRHEPPCLMVPRCLERLCVEACCQYGAVPDCTHQPMCELIPACCRKPAKEMVSVCSQHPHSCRIV